MTVHDTTGPAPQPPAGLPELTTRHATLGDLAALLTAQQGTRYDVVAPAAAIRTQAGTLLLDGAGPVILGPDGVTTEPGRFQPTGLCDTAIAEKLGIPTAYLRRLRAEQLGLYDANVNTWLAQDPTRPFLLRTLRPQDPAETGIARALLSDQYRIVDNLDVLLSVLDGIRAAGTPVTVDSADLTEKRMYVQVRANAVAAHAPTLLAGYTSPFSGARGAENPTVFAGFVIVNSETGHGSFSIIPRLVVEVCRNGLTITRDILRKVHLGTRLEEGVIRWSETTRQAAMDLITKQATDAVRTFLDVDYVHRTIAGLERTSGARVDDPVATIQHVSTQLRFTDEQRDTILNHFIDGGDRTAGGVLHAVTSAAQTQTDADAAYHLEQHGTRAMTLAATYRS